jgi:excisionase family DNA binding protein
MRRRRHGRPPKIEKEWYSKSEAAQYLGVAEITVTRYLERGVLHAHRLPTPGREGKHTRYDYGRLRIHKSELNRFLESVDRHPDEAQASQTGDRADETSTGGSNVTIRRIAYEPQEEQELARLAQAGDAEALERLRRDALIMTREEAALRLGVSWRTIKRYIESGALRLAGYFRCPDSYTRAHVFRSDVERLLGRDEPITDVHDQHIRGDVDGPDL